jgi:multicomponent Na+:H+ antiporter subunit B
MTSLILSTATRLLMPLLLMFSLFLLLRGHDAPGGGFAGGLVAAGAFALHSLSEGVKASRELLRIDTRLVAVLGLAIALLSGVVGMFRGMPFLTSVWVNLAVPGSGGMGTPLMFDIGVYMVVVGGTLTILFALAEEQQWKS